MGKFKRLSENQPAHRAPFIAEGLHTLELYRAIEHESQVNSKESIYRFEFKYVESTNQACKPGMPCTWLQIDKNKGWEGRVLACLEAITGESEYSEEDLENIFGEKNPLMGLKVKAAGTRIEQTTKKGEPIVNVVFSPAE